MTFGTRGQLFPLVSGPVVAAGGDGREIAIDIGVGPDEVAALAGDGENCGRGSGRGYR